MACAKKEYVEVGYCLTGDDAEILFIPENFFTVVTFNVIPTPEYLTVAVMPMLIGTLPLANVAVWKE